MNNVKVTYPFFLMNGKNSFVKIDRESGGYPTSTPHFQYAASFETVEDAMRYKVMVGSDSWKVCEITRLDYNVIQDGDVMRAQYEAELRKLKKRFNVKD